jgi:hypothetical protein
MGKSNRFLPPAAGPHHMPLTIGTVHEAWVKRKPIGAQFGLENGDIRFDQGPEMKSVITRCEKHTRLAIVDKVSQNELTGGTRHRSSWRSGVLWG